MIRLFSSTDKVFTSNGDVVLNPTKAIVHKADNGDYYLDLEMGLEYVDFIVEGNIIVAPTPTGDQAFRIGNVTKKKSKISMRCYHVFYDSENYLIVDSYVVNKNCNEALKHLNNATEPVSEFTVSSDISHIDSFRCVRKSLYEAIQTVLDRWGGHLVRDNFNIQIKSSIGQDNGIIVQYKKNLKDITCSENWDNVVTKILPVGRDGIMLNGVNPSADIYITSSTQYDLPYTKTISFNQDLNEQDYPSEQAFKEALVADLRAQATSYLATNCVPQVNYTLKANLEKLTDVGDVVEVIDERLGVHLMTNVIAFDYDCIFGKYTDIQFGNFPQTIAGLANRIASTTENYINGKGYTATSWNQIQESGAKIAEIVIDGRKYNVYAPNSESGSTVSWNQTQNSGDKIADVTIDGISQEVYAPNTQTFNEASSRVNINSVDTYPIIFGKIKKFFADLKNVAFSGSYSDLSGQPTKLSDFTNDENFVSDDPTFTEASTRANIASGESFATILGKIKKFFTDLKSVAFSGSYSDLSGTPTKLSDFTDDVGYLESSDITVTQVQTTGTKIATIDVDGTSTDLYAPAGGGGGSVNDVTVNGTSVVNAQGVAEVVTSDRVAKSGDTMSGTLTVQTSNQTPIRNKTTASNAVCYLNFANGDGNLGWFAVGNDRKPYFQSASDGTLKEIPMDVIKKGEWWTSGTSHNANDLRGEVVFAYNEASQQNVPTTGTLVSFACKKNNYPFQFQSAYTYDALYYRRQNGDNSTWGSWREIIHSGNIGNQSVSYANTAGSAPANGGNADTVDNFHFFAERYTNVVEVNQPTANQSWGVVIKTGDWDSDAQVVQLRCTGNNVSSTAVIYLVSRSKKIWGYNTYYNTAGIQGVVVTVSNSTDLHVCLFSSVTKIKIYKSWSGGSVATESLRSDYIDTTEASFFAYKPILTDITSLGTLTAKAIVVDNVIQIREPVNDNVVNLRKPNAVTATRNITLPNKDGTVALTSDISSRRYKENIIPLSEDEAKKILDVEIVNYDYKENVVDEDERYDQKGAIAEDVAELIPNAVTYADIDGEQLPDGINYTKFIPYLIKMVQMQQKEIEKLKELIKAKGE